MALCLRRSGCIFPRGPCLGCGVAYVCVRGGGREYTGGSGEGGEKKMGSIECLFSGIALGLELHVVG